jgi:hypothetical protein
MRSAASPDLPASNLQLVASSFDRYRFRRAEIRIAGGCHCFRVCKDFATRSRAAQARGKIHTGLSL